MNNDELTQLKQLVIKLTQRLEHTECRVWELTKLAFNNTQPVLTLTDAEQSLIRRLAAACEGGHPREWTNRALTADDRATLRGLLERTGGRR